MRYAFLLAIMLLMSSCCQAPSSQVAVSGAQTVAIVGQVIRLEHTTLTLLSNPTITSRVSDQTRILSDQGDTLESTALTPGTTVWLSMMGSSNAWHAQEIRVLRR